MNSLLTNIHNHFLRPIGLRLDNYTEENESKDYGACRFEIKGLKIVSRNAKITPTKIGQFVTLWKRLKSGPIAPFHERDAIDLLAINVENGKQLGQFVFPKSVLCARGVFSTMTREGKRGIRVYPPWDKPASKTALKTQAWQLKYFIELKEEVLESSDGVVSLYSI